MPGEWHNKIESIFPEVLQEVKFFCSTKNYNTSRRADICLSNKRTCEIQHSYISEEEISKRFEDWNIFGKEIIWFIDANNGVEINHLSTGNYLIKFISKWKYKSFLKKYEYILIEQNKLVFKIELSRIRSGMIEVKESKTLLEVRDFLLQKPENIWDFWSNDNTIKSILTVYQQGAGNGKTYGIWESIISNPDREIFIIVTKQHPAKQVIFEELMDQKERFINGEELYHIENLTCEKHNHTEKHYVIKYTDKRTGKEKQCFIGTIDSFCYNLSISNSKGSTFFKNIVDNISINGPTKLKNGYISFGGQYFQLSAKSEIWIDEVQDLEENYYNAMIKLMYETSCYINVVGDKLQSLDSSQNFLTTIVRDGLPNIEIIIKKPININRRIKVTGMSNEINSFINFDKYDLPNIKCNEKNLKENKDPIVIIPQPSITRKYNIDEAKIEQFCDTIIDIVKKEVEQHHYNPNDFLIVFPILKSNVIAPQLQTKLQEFWVDKLPNNEQYIQHVFFHKHEPGTTINTNDSKNATRIMSIKASKGDGRKVVFIFGVDEKSLKIVSKNDDLVYEAYLHVALTRAKNQIYFGLEEKNDEISNRFSKNGYIILLPDIKININLKNLLEIIPKDNIIEILTNNNINQEDIETDIKSTEMVDWGYHCIKHSVYFYSVILNIIENKLINRPQYNSHLLVKLKIISNLEINILEVKEFYNVLRTYKVLDDLPYIPLCKLSNKPEYKRYCIIIENAIKKIQKFIKLNKINELNIYESIILTYIIDLETNRQYVDIHPLDIYNITDIFQTNLNKEKELFDKLLNVKSIINKSGIDQYQDINWNIFKKIDLGSPSKKFTIYNPYNIIGNNKTDVIHIMLKSNISKLNFWDVMIEALLERFLLYNPKSDNDIKKFNNKKINTYIFLLDNNTCFPIDWDWDKTVLPIIKDEIRNTLLDYFQDKHLELFKYIKYIIDDEYEIWPNNPGIIIDNIINEMKEMKYPDYIITFFIDINTKIEEGDNYDYINEFETFDKKLTNKLNIHIKKFLPII